MLPPNRQIGSSPTPTAWSGPRPKPVLVRKQLAVVLALKIEQGQYSEPAALAIARAIVYELRRDDWLGSMKP